VWSGVRQWGVLIWGHTFVKENIFIEGGECADGYRTGVGISLANHLPKLFWLRFQYVG
jgi:hypothetical protein